ncbi:MAG: hypothetical protein LBV17_05800 [Treponema sp.]|jgi:hypothetical protein|nr:hypothetical protein [Treponema sp.]
MSDDNLYRKALEYFSDNVSGSSDFEKVCRIIVKFIYPDFDFRTPEGGQGTKDGGYDGRDSIKKAKLACSTEENYKKKIKEEVIKSKENGDLQIIYFSNQVIPEVNKIKIEEKATNEGIKIYISGIVELSKKIDEYFEYHNDVELYDLLKLSYFKAGECYRRGEIRQINNINIDKPYKKKIVIMDKNLLSNRGEKIISDNPLLEFILSCLSNDSKYIFNNISICGIGYLGKSYLMKNTFNYLINEFSDRNNYNKFKFIPFIQFCELKYYSKGMINDIIKNNIDPFLVFLDGLDELNETAKNELNSEIHNIFQRNKHINFIISGRNSSFADFEIFSNSHQLYLEKYIDPNDMELNELIINYKNTPLEDVLPIPMYRNYVLEKKIPKDTDVNELYSLLVRDNFNKDKERRDYSSKISSRMSSEDTIENILKSMSEFCYNLFISNKYVFSEIEIKNHFKNNEYFIFILNSSIIDYRDKDNISFISNFYFEYFVANALVAKKIKTNIKCFFLRGKIYIPYIDILMIFLNMSKSKSIKKYNYFIKKMKKENIIYILLSEFDLTNSKERYGYFKSIFYEYKKKNFWIYYGRFNQMYGALKNIDNMVQRMQLLLPYKYKIDAVNFIKKEIINFLQHPTKKYIMSFGNAVSLLIPFIDDLWTEAEQEVLKELSLKLIVFFMYNDLSRELSNILSERFIFNWYLDFKWTARWEQNDWENFYKDISGNSCNLYFEIFDENEFTIKYNIFRISYKDNKPLLFPLIKYVIKNKYMDGCGMASTVPEMLTDEYERPMIKTDDRIYELIGLIKEIDISLSEILDLLNYTIENNVYSLVKDSYDNPIKYFEEILYKNIHLINEEDFNKFSKYYFGIYEYEYDFDYRLFSESDNVPFIILAKFLIYEISDRGFSKWNTGLFLHRLINFTDSNNSIQYLKLIHEKMSENIYADTVYYINNNPKHILHNNIFIIDEYKSLFKNEIEKKAEREKKIEEIKKEIELVNTRDLLLIQDIDGMINEIKLINDYIHNQEMINEDRKKIGRLFSLYHKSILNTLSYSDKNENISIFSECAIKILENFYKRDIIEIDKITKELQQYLLKKENFYHYFYYFFIKKTRNEDDVNIDNIGIIETIKENKSLAGRIIESLNIDAQDKFINKPIEYFENNINWIIPFFFYYRTLLNIIRPTWMQDEHILKLIVVPDPVKIEQKSSSNDLNLDWITETFPTIVPSQIIDYGLKIIHNVTNYYSRKQMVKYFISYFKSTNKKEFIDRIIEFVINTTKLLFKITSFDHKYSEFQYIAMFWRECDLNFVDILFPKFTIQIVTSAIRKNDKDIDYQYRRDVLLYCCKVADIEQKKRIINDIDNDINDKLLSNEEKYEIQYFLASFGKEEAIRFILKAYLNNKEIPSRYSYNNYPIGFITPSNSILKDYMDLFFYSTAKSNERRSILHNMAKAGIKQHLNINNFNIFKKRMDKEIKKQIRASNHLSEYYYEYLLQIEQSVFS